MPVCTIDGPDSACRRIFHELVVLAYSQKLDGHDPMHSATACNVAAGSIASSLRWAGKPIVSQNACQNLSVFSACRVLDTPVGHFKAVALSFCNA